MTNTDGVKCKKCGSDEAMETTESGLTGVSGYCPKCHAEWGWGEIFKSYHYFEGGMEEKKNEITP